MFGMIISWTYSLQEEDNIEHTNPKCHVFTLVVKFLTIVWPKHRPPNIIEHTIIKAIEHTISKTNLAMPRINVLTLK